MPENKHEGHRERVRRDFLENGFSETTPPHKILEMLLFYSIPRRDTNEIAHELINTFGSIQGVFDAPIDQLLKVKGITENTVALLKMILPIASIYRAEKVNHDKNFTSTNQIGDYLLEKYLCYTKETVAITSFNGKGQILGFDVLAEGDSSSAELSIRKILEIVMKRNPVCVVLSHNHPSGFAIPSNEDLALTNKLFTLLANINVRLLDHIIIANNDYVSLAQSRDYKAIFQK